MDLAARLDDRGRGHRSVLVTTASLTAGLLATATLAGCGTRHVGDADPTTGDPPVLLVGTTAGASMALAGRTGPPKLRVDLPGAPSTAPVHRFMGEVPTGTVTALAAALALPGPLEQHAYGWSIGEDGGPRLVVRSDGTGAWAYTDGRDRCGQGIDVDRPDDPDSATRCAMAGDPAATPPGADRARTSAGPVLAAVGLSLAAATTQRVGGDLWFAVDPRVDGLVTVGLGTSVVVDATGVRAAAGHLRATTAGADYPLVDARTAWRSLADLPVPEIGILCPAPGPEDAPPCSTDPIEITGVELGLMLQVDPEGPLLVPAWVFTTSEGTTVPVLAVAPRYLGDPPAGPDDGTGGGSGRGSGSVEPGSPGSG